MDSLKPRWLSRTLLDGNHLTLCTSEERFAAVLKHLGVRHPVEWMGPYGLASHHAFEQKSGGMVSVVCIGYREGREGIAIAAMLAHEAVHVWQAFLERIGEDKPGKEMEAYAIQFILHELLTEYQRQVPHR